MSSRKVPGILAIDAGGTMTDTFIIDEKGEFVVGKAQTTPEGEPERFLYSSKDALSCWDKLYEIAGSLVRSFEEGFGSANCKEPIEEHNG